VQTRSRTAHTKFARTSVVGDDKDKLPHVPTTLELLGFCIVQIINAMSNKQPLISGALLGLPQALKTLLLQHTMIGKTNMVATGRLSQTFGFALITLSTI
jgi:hypothetical protein